MHEEALMNILDMFLHSNQGELTKQLGESFPLEQEKVSAVLNALMSAMGSKTEAKIQSGGLAALMQQFGGMEVKDVLAAPDKLDTATVQEQGRGVLDGIFARTEQNEVIQEAASASGVDQDIVQQVLAALAAAIGGYFKNSFSGAEGGLQALMGGDGNQLAEMLGGFLDQDKDGQVSDDIASLAKKFL